MNRERRDASNGETGRPGSVPVERRRAETRSQDGTGGAVSIDLIPVYCAIALSLVAIPLLVGGTFVVGTVPPPGSAAFYGLVAITMAPGLLMGTTALWLCARSDPG